MKKHWFLFTIFIAFSSMQLSAQRWVRERNQLIIGFGATGFMGDLGGADGIGTQGFRDFNFGAIRPGATIGYRYHLMQYLALKGTIAFGYVYGDDRLTDEVFRNRRNIHFRSPVLETSVQGEYYFWHVDRLGDRYRRITRSRGWIGWDFKAYVFAGIGGFYFEPQARFLAADFNQNDFPGVIPAEGLPPDGWYNLRALRTEGQGYFPTRDTYSPLGLVVPMGVGITFSMSRELTFGVEYGFRKTFTDYIDDVSTLYIDPNAYGEMFDDPRTAFLAQYFGNPTTDNNHAQTKPAEQRGNPHNDDAYMFLFVTLSYKFPDSRIRGRIPGL